MRIFIYKIIITVVSLFLLYQLTVGYSIYKFQQKIYTNFSKVNSEKIKLKFRKELKASLKKERILNKEDSLLIRDFFNKIISEVNNTK
tara:strand:- start:337 stop:600 length:264 start_codon:yes stop_codon:yes gene_type:complete